MYYALLQDQKPHNLAKDLVDFFLYRYMNVNFIFVNRYAIIKV